MKTRMIYHSLAICCLLPTFAFTTGDNDPLAKSPTVAKLTNTPNGPLIGCDLKALKDTVNFPLSQLTEELQIVSAYWWLGTDDRRREIYFSKQ